VELRMRHGAGAHATRVRQQPRAGGARLSVPSRSEGGATGSILRDTVRTQIERLLRSTPKQRADARHTHAPSTNTDRQARPKICGQKRTVRSLATHPTICCWGSAGRDRACGKGRRWHRRDCGFRSCCKRRRVQGVRRAPSLCRHALGTYDTHAEPFCHAHARLGWQAQRSPPAAAAHLEGHRHHTPGAATFGTSSSRCSCWSIIAMIPSLAVQSGQGS